VGGAKYRMPQGRHYHQSRLMGPVVRRQGTKVNEIRIGFYHVPFYTTAGDFLYDEDMSRVAAFIPVLNTYKN
jgi:hypothetical protein